MAPAIHPPHPTGSPARPGRGGGVSRPETAPTSAAPTSAAPAPDAVRALAQAHQLAAALAPAARVVAQALGPAAASLPEGPADYAAYVLRRRLGRDDLRGELEAGLASLRALEALLATREPALAELEALTAGASRLTWLLGQHPALADLGLLARRPSAA